LNKNSYNEPRVIHDDQNETSTTNSSYHTTATSHSWETSHPVVDSLAKGKTELKKGQHQGEDIITKTKRVIQEHWEQTRTSLGQVQKKVGEMVPKQSTNLIYWRNPIQSGIVFGLSLSVIITFMFFIIIGCYLILVTCISCCRWAL